MSRVLASPERIGQLTIQDWDVLIRQARRANLLATLSALLQERGVLERLDPRVQRHLRWSASLAGRQTQAVRNEVGQISLALREARVPLVLLKGAAYVLAGLPAAQGRLFSDIDILVPKASLEQVEASMMLHGWATTHHDDYDQRYYRTWMHELPPMQHIKRLTVIDIHHAILPETAPLHPDSGKLLAAAIPLAGHEHVRILAPADMVLHSMVHLLHDGELQHGMRDLYDIHRLLQHFSTAPDFWNVLLRRAAELELSRPLFYGLRYTQAMLNTAIPQSCQDAIRPAGPRRWLLAVMDQLFLRALLPDHASCNDSLTGAARFALYIRANWLRMPPLLLARHLFHKAFISPKEN